MTMLEATMIRWGMTGEVLDCGFYCLSRGCGVLKMSDDALKYNIKDTGRDVSSHLRIEMTMPEMRAL